MLQINNIADANIISSVYFNNQIYTQNMGNVVDHNGNVHTHKLYIGDVNVVIDLSGNFFGETAHFTNININNKKFVDKLRNVNASNVTCGTLNTGNMKINGKQLIDKNLNLTANSVKCNELIVDLSGATITGDVMCSSGNMFCNNLYLPSSIDNTVGRIRCTTVNTDNIIIPTYSNSFFANLDFSVVINGTDGSITTTNLTSLNGIDTSGNINCEGKITSKKFIIPTIESNASYGADTFLPNAYLEQGEIYYDKYDGTIYIYKDYDAGYNRWLKITSNSLFLVNASP